MSDDLQQAILPDESENEGALWLSPAMRDIQKTIRRIASRPVPVLITGESGTGKEVVAKMIHELSGRKGPFVDVNCAALPRDLIESELFGAVKGAYTGSYEARAGRFRKAEHGTIFLDELAEMPIDTQSKLLRVIQEKEVWPVGGSSSHPVNCRVLAATNRVPHTAILDGRLREDLFYRLATIEIDLPPLRQRSEEILPLARRFLDRSIVIYGLPAIQFSPGAEAALRGYDWPGNVRQLQSLVHRAALMVDTTIIEAKDFAFSGEQIAQEWTPEARAERERIIEVLKRHQGHRGNAAEELGLDRKTLFRHIKRLHISL